jgi:hypothetical protein
MGRKTWKGGLVMGMYDEVFIPCPNCGLRIYEQTKTGPKQLNRYEFDKAPHDVLFDLLCEHINCPYCRTHLSVVPRFEVVNCPIDETLERFMKKVKDRYRNCELLKYLLKKED